MKKNQFQLLIVSFIVLLTSCENFFNGNMIKDELDRIIEYANASYADITINSLNAATESIVPATGNYNNKYKKTDKIELSFISTNEYQFIKWTASPEGSVCFENCDSSSTTAEIISIDSAITIEPVLYKRAEVTLSPGNVVDNPRNATVVISFSDPMCISDEDLRKIDITIDGASVLANFNSPVVSSDKTKITYIPKRDNFIDVASGTKTVRITVPSSIYYEKSGVKVALGKEIVYTYRINSTTETNAEISVNCLASEGDLSYSGTKTYYLDSEFSVTCVPKESYLFSGWKIKYADGSDVEENILQLEESSEQKTLKVKVLTGTSKTINIVPILVEKGALAISFTTAHGVTVPSEPKIYYVGDTFTINYREGDGYAFRKWEATYETNGEDASKDIVIYNGEQDDNGTQVLACIAIENVTSEETKCKVIRGGESIILTAACGIRPQITGFTPTYTGAGVDRDSRIRILFSQSMAEKSFFWTKAELDQLGITESEGYTILSTSGKIDAYGNKLYYAYYKGSKTDLVYRNIQIHEPQTDENFLRCYGEPFFENNKNKVLVIPANTTGADIMSGNTEVEVIVSANCESRESLKLTSQYIGSFVTNTSLDQNAPELNVTYFEIQGCNRNGYAEMELQGDKVTTNVKNVTCTTNYQSFTTRDFAPDIIDTDPVIRETWNFYPKIEILNNEANAIEHILSVKIKAKITDTQSKPAYIRASLVPIKTELKQSSQIFSDTIKLNSDQSGVCDLSEEGVTFNFKVKEINQGVYKIVIEAADYANNIATLGQVCGFCYTDNYRKNINVSISYPNGSKYYEKYQGKAVNTYAAVISADDFEVQYNAGGQILRPAREVSFQIENLPNHEYSVYLDEDSNDTGEQKWISTEEKFNFSELLSNKNWKPTETNPSKRFTVEVRDVYGRRITTKSFYLLYGQTPKVSVTDMFSISGRGLCIMYKVTVPAEDVEIKKIYTQIKNKDSDNLGKITGVTGNTITEDYAFTAIDSTSVVIDYLIKDPSVVTLKPKYLESSGKWVVSGSLLIAGIKYEKGNISAKIMVEDAEGIQSQWDEKVF